VPRLSVWTLRLAFMYLLAGFTLGALMLANKGLSIDPTLWNLLPAHVDFLLFGWTLQFVFGVAFWILPRFSKAPRRGNENLAWTAVILLNAGIWIDGVGPLLVHFSYLNMVGRGLLILAAIVFSINAWPRVKPSGA
jgi:heme/copper-type cytochrome/quinol oxidase subunit 1